MYISPEEQTILYGVYRSSLAWLERDPTFVVMVVPILFVCNGKDMCSLEATPYAVWSAGILFLRYNAASISLAYLIPKHLYSCSRTKGLSPGDNNLIGDIDSTY